MAALVLAACGDGGPRAGTVELVLTGTDARAVRLKVAGPVLGVTAVDPAVRVFGESLPGDTMIVVVIAEEGHTFDEQPLALLEVSDVDAARSYVIEVVQVAGPNYSLLDPASYSVTVGP